MWFNLKNVKCSKKLIRIIAFTMMLSFITVYLISIGFALITSTYEPHNHQHDPRSNHQEKDCANVQKCCKICLHNSVKNLIRYLLVVMFGGAVAFFGFFALSTLEPVLVRTGFSSLTYLKIRLNN